MVTSPLPLSAGTWLTTKGPAGTSLEPTARPFTNTSTVEGTTAVPVAASNGVVTRSGRMA